MTGLLLRVSIGDVDHLDALRVEGAAFASVLDRADLGLPVPACGEWRLRELAHHLGGVHRWATAPPLRWPHRRCRRTTRWRTGYARGWTR